MEDPTPLDLDQGQIEMITEHKLDCVRALTALLEPLWHGWLFSETHSTQARLRDICAAISKLACVYIRTALETALRTCTFSNILIPDALVTLIASLTRSKDDNMQIAAYLQAAGLSWTEIRFWITIWEKATTPMRILCDVPFAIGIVDEDLLIKVLQVLADNPNAVDVVSRETYKQWVYFKSIAANWIEIMEHKRKYLET